MLKHIMAAGFTALFLSSQAYSQTSDYTATASRNSQDARLAIDGDPNTRWTTSETQRNGQVFMLDLGDTRNVNQVSLNSARSPNDGPAEYSVAVSTNGSNFNNVATGSNGDALTVIDFPTQSVRYVRIAQNGSKNRFWWSIHEISVSDDGDSGDTGGNEGTAEGEPLDRSNWVMYASRNSASTFNAIDGNPRTRWTTQQDKRPGQFFEIDLQSTETFSAIALDSTASPNDYPSDYDVLVSNDGNSWVTVASGNSNSAVTTISFSEQNARYIRIVQNGTSDRFWWSIHDLNVFAPDSPTGAPVPQPVDPVPPTGDNVVDVYMVTGQSNVKDDWSDAIEARLNNLNRDRESVVVMNRHPGNPISRWWDNGAQRNFRSDLNMLEDAFDDLEDDGKEPRLNGFFWLQGESDAGRQAQMDTYAVVFKSFTAEFFNEMNTDNNRVPIAIAVIDNEPPDAGTETMRGIQFDLGNELNGFAFDTRGYNRFDQVHMTGAALRDLGEDMADKFYNDHIR